MIFLQAVCFIISCHLWISEQVGLNDYILDYQRLDYDQLDLHTRHTRVRRSLDPHLYLSFAAYGRAFRLKLKRDTSVFSSDHKILEEDGSLLPVDTSFIYSGYLEDSPGSYAHLAVINGTARGYVQIPGNTTYHIEPATMYFKSPTFHTVIYPETHMDLDPYRHRRSAEVGVCGNDHAAAWMKWVSESAIDSEPVNRARRYRRETEDSTAKNKYSSQSNSGSRHRRSKLGDKNTCYLYLRADPILWEHMKTRKYNSILTDERTQEEILAFFASHVSAVKNIYSKTKFHTYDYSIQYTGVDFVVQRTSIMTMENQKCTSKTPTRFCNRNIDVTNFLNLNSFDQHDEFCLAYIFTFRDFTKGTLGLAWVATSKRYASAGGVCERHKRFPEGGIQVSKSLNTGIVTVVNYGKAVPARVSQLTFAHEIGHNFGSPHDDGPVCAPYGSSQRGAEDGNYIMFASATMGDKPNNDDFSICSKDNISRVLDLVLNEKAGRFNCFQKSTQAFCGNGITEDGEECDCGYKDDCEDRCCYGKGSTEGRECTLRGNVQCSPTAGPCCSVSCKYISKQAGTICQPADDCKAKSLCGGDSAQCPQAQQKANGTFCNDFSQICVQGECASSVCHRISWEECFLTSEGEDDGPSREAMCYVSCRNPKTQRCVSSHSGDDINRRENLEFRDLLMRIQRLKSPDVDSIVLAQGIQLPAGSPCDNFRGYCDVFHKCRGVDADGPLARLKNLIFDPKTLRSIKDWIVVNWWAVMLMSAGLVIVMAVFIKVCAVHTPSSNPRKPKARKLTMTLRRQHHRRNHNNSQTTALTSHEHRSRGHNPGQGSSSGSGRPERHRSLGQGNKSSNAAATASSSGGGSGAGAGGGPVGGAEAGNSSSSAGAAAVVVEKVQNPPPPYTAALLPGNPPPHGKGRRNRRRERGMELQRL